MYPKGDVTEWQKDRLGMFIHWGIYSMVARNEWCMKFEKMSMEEYQFLIDNFTADLFEPAVWAQAAKAAGMKYMIFTTKHHDGFCMWDSAHTDYKITHTPFGRDALREIVDAFRAEGIKIGLYYSISDWTHSDYRITKGSNHPLQDQPEEELAELNRNRDMARYAQYMRDQVRELLTDYGEIMEFWFDVSGEIDPELVESEAMLELIRQLQPGVILNNRLSLPGAEDILTPENYLPESGCVDDAGKPVPWEGCHTLSAAWTYNRDEKSYNKSPERIIDILVTQTSMGGNSLFNVGPTSRGVISDLEQATLDVLAHWMRFNGRSITGCGAVPEGFPLPPRDCRYTYNEETNRVYVHLLRWPDIDQLILPGLSGRICYAQLLHDGSKLFMHQPASFTNENLNPRIPAGAAAMRLLTPPEKMPVPVIECFLSNQG